MTVAIESGERRRHTERQEERGAVSKEPREMDGGPQQTADGEKQRNQGLVGTGRRLGAVRPVGQAGEATGPPRLLIIMLQPDGG